MATFFTRMLESQNIVEANEIARTGDLKGLGNIIRNGILITKIERANLEIQEAEASLQATREREAEEYARAEEARKHEREMHWLEQDREAAIKRNTAKRNWLAGEEVENEEGFMDSDQAMDRFLGL